MYNLSRICNLCLNDLNLKQLLDENSRNNKVNEAILFVLPELIIMQPDDFIRVCSKCLIEVNNFFNFKTMCLKNNATLWASVNTLQTEAKDPKLQPNETIVEQQTERDKIPEITTPTETVTNYDISDHLFYTSKHKPEVSDDPKLQSSAVTGDEQTTESVPIFEKVTITEAISSIENPEHSPVQFEHKQTKDEDNNDENNDSDLEELFAYLKSSEETSHLTESASISSDEDICAEYIEDNSETIASDTNNKTNTSKFECLVCSRTFKKIGHVRMHLKTHKDITDNSDKFIRQIPCAKHNENNELECLICNKIFKHSGHLNIHLKMHKDIRNFQCYICGKRFVRNETLKCHMDTHSETKNYECSICDKKFLHRVSLTKHMKVHTGYDKEYECSICSKKFTLKGSFVRHMNMHAGIKNFECLICNWKFQRKHHRDVHMKIHTGINEFECSVCHKRFLHNSYLKNHMKLHTGIKDLECSKCHKKFLRGSNLRSHMRRKHGDIKKSE